MFLRRVSLGGGWWAMSSLAVKKAKETTGIVGLGVVPNAREVLISLSRRSRLCPRTRAWSKASPDTGFRSARRRRNGCQVEELIEKAKDEITLISKMIEWDIHGKFLKTMNVRLLKMTLPFLNMFPNINLALSRQSSSEHRRQSQKDRYRRTELPLR